MEAVNYEVNVSILDLMDCRVKTPVDSRIALYSD